MPGWLEIVLRSSVGIIVVLVGAKLFVRKAIGELSYFEFIVAAAVAIIVGIGSVALSIPAGHVAIALFIWIFIPYIIGSLSVKSKTFRNVIGGKGIPIIKDGKVLEDNIRKGRYTTDELLSKLRTKDVFRVADVEFAVLEPNGAVNVLLKKDYQPLTPKDMQIQVAPIKQPETVIMDGKILDEPLATIGFNRRWLEHELDKIGVAIENVYLGQIDSYGELTVDVFDDQIEIPEPVEKPLLFASIKKCQADLEVFSMETESEQAKKMYQRCAKDMDDVMKKLKPILR
ncbi:DUF421 domain-containing protein [Alkalihalobacterium chitinilyticum]|uniref:DUF421 domain-containing protein n=1 Tax=Alkalihalobacterium chitinilyticum TaxID=2980103 RepID=A0ABT5V974_9BACI|nr:DUF421 domain-containing protein [Alkalihalobacterium chitinilyticum]MDE5412012.1 DUF421 domain-containing protein [Alkalihalobacterium chitinilyticum]